MQTGRGLCPAGVGWVAGIALQLQQRELWPIVVYQALAATGLLLVLVLMLQAWWPRSRRAERVGRLLPPALWLLAAAALSLGSTGWRAADRLGETLDADLEGRDVEVVGVVASLPQFRVDGVRFELLQPAPALYERPDVKPNTLSCVLRLSGGGRSALLTGDIERDGEAAMVAAYGAKLRSDVLIVPHHGSKTSSSAAFLDAVQPRIAVMQAGYRNRYGHPSPAVLASYRERGIHVMLSASCGAWRWRPGVQSCQRDIARRYWQHVWHHPDLPQYEGSGLELADPD